MYSVARELLLDREGRSGNAKKKRSFQIWTAFFVPENSVLQKKQKVFTDFEPRFCPRKQCSQKKGICQISTAFFAQKIVLRGAQVAQGAKILPGRHVPPAPILPVICMYFLKDCMSFISARGILTGWDRAEAQSSAL